MLENASFVERKRNVAKSVRKSELKREFEKILMTMTSGKEPLEYGHGQWLELLKGKRILQQVVNSKCFKVKGAGGRDVQGKEKLLEIAKELIKKPLGKQPDDFQELYRLIMKRVNA